MSHNSKLEGVSRRTLLTAGAGLVGGLFLLSLSLLAFAAVLLVFGSWPDGSKGDTVNIGAAVPRTGAYAVQGEDELKGWQLAVEHINSNNELMKKLAPKINNG